MLYLSVLETILLSFKTPQVWNVFYEGIRVVKRQKAGFEEKGKESFRGRTYLRAGQGRYDSSVV
jgi:hypothetical protein